jgi:hypothetical protein
MNLMLNKGLDIWEENIDDRKFVHSKYPKVSKISSTHLLEVRYLLDEACKYLPPA